MPCLVWWKPWRAQVEIGPAIRGGNRVVHLDLQRPEGDDVSRDFVRGVEAVVRCGQPFATRRHDIAAMRVVSTRRLLQARRATAGTGTFRSSPKVCKQRPFSSLTRG